jgi:hypothetical protein
MEDRTLTDKIICSGALICSQDTNRFLLLQKAHGKHALISKEKHRGKVCNEKLKKKSALLLILKRHFPLRSLSAMTAFLISTHISVW